MPKTSATTRSKTRKPRAKSGTSAKTGAKAKVQKKPKSSSKGKLKTPAQAGAMTPHHEDGRVLSIDIGGTKVKMLIDGELEARKAPSGKELTPLHLVEIVNELTSDWKYHMISIGIPGLVGPNGPLAEPGNLGPGWVGFDFANAFGKPVKIMNDAAMQAVGSYEGGRMLFLGFGTGLGSALIIHNSIVPLELGRMRWNSRQTMGEVVGRRGLNKLGIKKWRKVACDVIIKCMGAFVADYVMVGGGNAKLLKEIPPGARLGHNQTAFRGGFRIWGLEDVVPTQGTDSITDSSGEAPKNWSMM